MGGSRVPRWGTVAGIVVGSAVSVGLVAAGPLRAPERRDLRDARVEFLTAWERSRRAVVVVRSEFTRRQANGEALESATELVQRPPDRIVRQFGGVSGVVGGHPLVCSTDAGGTYRCFPGTEQAPPFDETLRKELDTLRSYFEAPTAGARPLYRTIHGREPGCFDLFLQLPYPDPPYGTSATMCFDEATGARRLHERHLENGTVETEKAVLIEPRVSNVDFDTKTNGGFEPEIGGGTTTTTAAVPGTTAPPRVADGVAAVGAATTTTNR